MKKAILILTVLLVQFNFSLVAQTIEINDQSLQYATIENVFYLGNEKWLLGGDAEEIYEEELYLKVVDSLSEISVAIDPNSSTIITIEKFKVKGNLGYGLFRRNGARVIGRFEIFPTHISILGFLGIAADEVIQNFEVLPNGNLVVVGTKVVGSEYRGVDRVLNAGINSLIFEDYLSPGYFSDVLVMPDSTFLLTGGFGENQIFGGKKYSQTYEELGDIMEGIESDQIFPIENNGYLLLKDQTITKLDNDFQIETSVDFASYGLILNMVVDDENVFLLYQEYGATAMILRINHSLEVENSFELEDENFRAESMDVSENEIGIGGYVIPNVPFSNTPSLYPSTSGYFKTFSKNGMSEGEDVDLEIIGVKVVDHEKEYYCGLPEMTSSYLLHLKNIKVGLVNKGTTVINSVDLFMEVVGLNLCVTGTPTSKYYSWQEHFSLLNLEPNDTLWWRISPIEFIQKIEDTTSVNLCMWHTSVENKRDLNPANDYFCGDVPLETGYVEPPIIEPNQGEVLIFPNPLNEKMTVSLSQVPFDPTVIEFYDYMGRALDLKYFIAPRAKYKEFDISQLASGFYFCKISNDLFEDMIRVYVN